MASIFDSMPDYGSFIQNSQNQTGLGTPQVSASDFTRIPISGASYNSNPLVNYDSQNPMTFSTGSPSGGGNPLSAGPSGNSSGGFFSNLWQDIVGGYDRGKGALQGGMEGAYGGFPNAVMQSGGNPFKFLSSELGSTAQGIKTGFMNPEQQNQDFQQANNAVFAPLGSASWAPKFVTNSLTDPLSYVPLEKPLSIAGNAIKAGSDLVGLTPYVKSAINTVTASKPVSAVTNVLKDAFSKNWNATPDLKQGLQNLYGNIAGDKLALMQQLPQIAQTHGLTLDEVNQLPEVFEAKGSNNPKLAQAYQDLNNALNTSVMPDGFKIGTNAETTTMFNGKPILDPESLLKDIGYYPQRYPTDMNPQIEQKMQELIQSGKKGFTTTGPFNQERLFHNVAEAEANGFNPERNAYAAIAERLAESSKQLRTAQFLQDMMDKGVISKEALPGMKPSEIKPLSSYFDVVEKRGNAPAATAEPNPLLPYAKGEPAPVSNPLLDAADHANNVSDAKGQLSKINQMLSELEQAKQAAVDSQFQYLKGVRGADYASPKGGVTKDGSGYVTGTFSPTSYKPREFQDALGTFNKKYLTNDDLRQLAEQHINEGFHSDTGFVPPWHEQTGYDSLQQARDEIQKSIGDVTNIPKTITTSPFSLPRELSKASPRYSSNPLKFESDLDRAAYILGNPSNRSARDADFLKLVMNHTGLGEGEVRNLGGQVRDTIKNIVGGVDKGSTVKVPSMLENYLRDRAANAETSAAAEGISANPMSDMGTTERMPEGASNNLHDAANFESLANSPDAQTTIDKIVKVNPYFVKPADEKAVNEFLNPSKPSGVFAGLNKLNNLYNEAFLKFSPLPHMHNIGTNGMYLGGANPEYVADAFKDIKNGVSNPWHDEAVRSGAVSGMRGGNIMKSVNNAMKKKGKLGKVVDTAKYVSHDVLWDTDSAIRTALYRQAKEAGASSAEAAAKTNKFMADYNNLTPFEKKYVKPLVPFYSWKKSNVPLQLSQMLAQTPKYAIYDHLKDAISQAASGQPTDQKGRIQTGVNLPDGSHVVVDPYSPMDEPAKIAEKGVVPWALGSLNPFFKEAESQLGLGSFPVKYNSQAPMDYNARQGISHAINSLNPLGGSAIAGQIVNPSNVVDNTVNFAFNHLGGNPVNDIKTKDVPNQTSTELATKLLGGFTARDNPAKDAMNQKYQNRTSIQDQIKYLKDTGQPVSKYLKRAAYQKVR